MLCSASYITYNLKEEMAQVNTGIIFYFNFAKVSSFTILASRVVPPAWRGMPVCPHTPIILVMTVPAESIRVDMVNETQYFDDPGRWSASTGLACRSRELCC